MSILPHFPIIPSRGSQEASPYASTDTLKPGVPGNTTSPPYSENRRSPKSVVPVGALKRRPSLSQVIGRVRSASGSSTVSDGSKSVRTIRKAKSLKSLTNRPSSSPNPDCKTVKGQNLRDLAPWDRTVDVVYHQYPRGYPRPDKSLDFERSVDLFLKEHGRHQGTAEGYFSLPAAVRSRIWEHVTEANPNDKPIALTMARWNKDAWRKDEFLNLSEAMESLRSYLEVSFEFRADILVHFLMTRRFHITYSLCVGTRLNPLATKWVEKYSHYMQDIALEIVLTEYRFGLNPHAHLLVPATTRLETLIQEFVRSQLKRRPVSTLNSLVMLCRRFHGRRRVSSRPRSVEGSGDDYVYCPNRYLEICDPIKKLRDLVDSVRICGFSQPYTISLIESLFSVPATDKLKLHSYSVAPSTVWPQLDGQEAQVDAGEGRIKVQKFSGQSDGRRNQYWGAIQLPAPAGYEPGADWLENQIWLRQVTVPK